MVRDFPSTERWADLASSLPWENHLSPLVPSYPKATDDLGNEEAFDPWRSSDAQQRYSHDVTPHEPRSDSFAGTGNTSFTAMKSHNSGQSESSASYWVGEERNESGSPTLRRPPPQPLPPTRIYPQASDVSGLPATPPSHLGSFQRLALTPSRPSGHQRPVLTPLGPSPHSHPMLTSTGLSPHRYPESSRTTVISSPPRNQQTTQTPPACLPPDRHPGQIHFKKMSDKYQAHRLSQESPASPSPRRRGTWATPLPSSSIPPTLSRPLSSQSLDPQLAEITHIQSRLTKRRKSYPKVFFA